MVCVFGGEGGGGVEPIVKSPHTRTLSIYYYYCYYYYTTTTTTNTTTNTTTTTYYYYYYYYSWGSVVYARVGKLGIEPST
jgi:hypothetical protein